MGEVLNNGVYLPDRGERNAYDGLKGNWNTLDSIAGKVPGYDGHISDTDIHVTAADKQTWNGKADASHVHNADDVTTGVFDAARIPNLDASKITTGTIDIDRLPQGALERLVKVADQSARYALTAADVQLGDTVQQLDTGVMYVVTDETKLDSADGYTEYTAGSATSVPWSGVTGKPADYTPASHSHGNITNDGKVGTTANLPLITGTGGVVQAGSFGNAANTFCEGNDSRLSDARTPVAHTHTKSDVTDLLNSNFIPSANNSYDLGSNSNQWNNLYAKSYYYNGTAWGLDKVNSWTGINYFNTLRLYGAASNNLVAYPPSGEKGDSSTFGFNIICSDKNLGAYAASGVANIGMGQSGGTSYVALNVSTIGRTDHNNHSIQIGLQIAASDNANIGSFYPSQNGGINLGISTNKWKTLNGINPGALSLPDTYTNIDTTNWDLTGTLFSYTPPIDGWLFVNIRPDNNYAYVSLEYASMRNNSESTTGKNAMACIAVRANTPVSITLSGASIAQARLVLCAGNV